MTLLVTQDQALAQLRLIAAQITPDELADVMFKAEQASDIVIDYLKGPGTIGAGPAPTPYDTSPVFPPGFGGDDWIMGPPPVNAPPKMPQTAWDATTVPMMIQGVILVVLTSLYDGRTPNDPLLSDQLTAVLCRYRDPALA